ncbi:hypothetical protein J437_LFUL008961 [Ladona fulva]|uniref:Uncharacterized protein n=1 Tax=Ladona fulva TaxID=123851 RepID=A0A8K0KF41_LADFU|nr:hypothetical protein J437_LFUL008961 [Ladona fulva]
MHCVLSIRLTQVHILVVFLSTFSVYLNVPAFLLSSHLYFLLFLNVYITFKLSLNRVKIFLNYVQLRMGRNAILIVFLSNLDVCHSHNSYVDGIIGLFLYLCLMYIKICK